MHTFTEKPKANQLSRSPKATVTTQSHLGHTHQINSALRLQRKIGNQAAHRLLQSDAEERNTVFIGITSPHFGHGFNRIPIPPPTTRPTQTKLAINKPGDEYEQEADRVADQVMRMPEPRSQSARDCSEGRPRCQTEPHRIQGKGNNMPSTQRDFFEPRFGADFSGVRLHTDNRSAEMADNLGAKAFTVGNDIVFGSGMYRPESSDGKHLMAHELTHTIQQKGAKIFPKSQLKAGERYIQAERRTEHPAFNLSPIPASVQCERDQTSALDTPVWCIENNESNYGILPNRFRWLFRCMFNAPNIDSRFLIVQWMRGYISGCLPESHGGGCAYAIKRTPHQGRHGVPFNFPNWVIDTDANNAEYPGLTKRGDNIGLSDHVGVGQSPRLSSDPARRWPPGSEWIAAMEFRVHIYDRASLSGLTINDLQFISSPAPVDVVTWEFLDSWTVPNYSP